MMEKRFDVEKAIQDQLRLLLDCNNEDDARLIQLKLNALLAIYSTAGPELPIADTALKNA